MRTRLDLLRSLMYVVFLVAAMPAHADSDSFRDSAKQRFEEGKDEFEAKHYPRALELFRQSYAIAPYPALLFNIARCQEELGMLTDAVDSYQRYLAVHPDDEVRSKLAVLRKKLTETPPPPVVVAEPVVTAPPAVLLVTAPPPPRKKPVYKQWWLWTGVGIVVAAGVGLGLGFGLSPHTTSTFPPLQATP